MSHDHRDLFARDGHPTMLSLDRYDVGELEDGARRSLEHHVEHCGDCRARLQAVATPAVVLAPRMPPSRSTGSATVAYLATTAAVALAASLVLGVGSALVPSPSPAQESASEPALMASSYTSVAQEYSETSVDVELTVRGDRAIATPGGDAHLAVVVLAAAADAGDTDEVVDVLYGPRFASGPVSLGLPRKGSRGRVVAIACAGPFTVESGDTFVPDRGCVTSEP